MKPTLTVRGFEIFKGALDRDAQESMCEDLRAVAAAAPFFTPVTPSGRKMSVRMTAAGKYGWFTDKKGYRYIDVHPSGAPWPPIPESVLELWRQYVSVDREPDCCLVNFYSSDARMGLHQDEDEADFSWPVLSASLGDEAVFRMGGTQRRGSTESVRLSSGDVVRMGGEARLAYHGIDRIRKGSSTLLSDGGRINLTLRVVD